MAVPAISDSSSLVALHQIGRLDLLQHLFASVMIPPAVKAETAGSVGPIA